MRSPVCFSQYFTNKQNVRSFSNILQCCLLKTANYPCFLRNIIEDEFLLKEMSVELKQVLFDLQHSIKTCSKHDFKEYLLISSEKFQELQVTNKLDVLKSCYNALNRIIPVQFYGNNHNYKIFRKCVKFIIYSMNRQHIYLERLIKNWDHTILPWSTMTPKLSSEILYNIINWMFNVIVSGIISLNYFVTSCKLDADENKLYFFRKDQWQKFYDKKVSDMVTAKVLYKYEPYCLGKKIKRKYNAQERQKLRTFKRNTPKLHLVLKTNNGYRPIVRYRKESIDTSEKFKIKERLQFIHNLNNKRYEKIENKFSTFYNQWLLKNKPHLYFVKTDLSNAFGSINKIKLLKILATNYLEFQKREKSLYVKKKFAQQYKELITELRRPLLIRAGSTIYEWREGLVQGYKYSPALSELYYSYLDNIYFIQHMKIENDELKLFIRVVDDYLYITDSLEDTHSFLNALSNYRNVNYSKTYVNFPHPVIKFSQEITFLGYSYNTINLQVSRAKAVYTGDICYKIAFSAAIHNLGKFIHNRIGQSGIQVNGHVFNFHHNEEKIIWHHIFTTLCLSANKFCTILAFLCDEGHMSKFLIIYKKRVVVKLCNSIIETLRKNQPPDFMFKYCINHFSYLSYKALLLCCQLTSKCNILVPYINNELGKTNCINGKWREHASRISKSGQILMPAIREVCRRADLKIIMKNFEKLPEGFQCFDQKRFYL